MDNMTPVSPPGEMDLMDYNYLALVLGVPLILVIILGNILVCLSVLTERSLKTATNYFIISLAVADLLLAVLVLPLYVYSEVSVYKDQSEFMPTCEDFSLFMCSVSRRYLDIEHLHL